MDVENKHGHKATSVLRAQCETIRRNCGNNLIKSVTRGKSGSSSRRDNFDQMNRSIAYLEWVVYLSLLLLVLYVKVIPEHEKNAEYSCMFVLFVMH
jgi:hypothetical protein